MEKNSKFNLVFIMITAFIVMVLVAFLGLFSHLSATTKLFDYMDYDQQAMQISYWHKESIYQVPTILQIDKEDLVQCFKDTKVATKFTINTKNTARIIIEYRNNEGIELQLVIYDTHEMMLTTLNQSVPYRQFLKDTNARIFDEIKQRIHR